MQETKTGLNRNFLLSLMSYTNSIRPVIWISNCPEALEIDPYITKIAGKKTKIAEYNTSFGIVSFDKKTPSYECNLEEFLKLNYDEGLNGNVFLVLKDVTEELQDARVTSIIRMISERNFMVKEYYCTIFVLSNSVSIPKDIEEYTTIIEYPIPKEEEIKNTINKFLKDYELQIKEADIDTLAFSFKGLNNYQIRQILGTAYQQKGMIRLDDKELIMREKMQFLKKSGLLEIVNVKETRENIGGLEELKKWLENKAYIFKNPQKALNYNVDIPRGVMIMGMPGCGKSLTAKVTSLLFEIPLVRLDIGRLLGKYVGESEMNMRQALQLAEAISPCILWIDELEKAFSGVGSGGTGNEVTVRLFGQFLTWMQEKESMVFIVATANDISAIPPEFLRKGRFDEIFFVGLPTKEEIEAILEIHLKKRNKSVEEKELKTLIERLSEKGFCGADIEGIVREVIEKKFIDAKDSNELPGAVLQASDFDAVIADSKSIKETMKEKIEQIEKTIKRMEIKNASTKV